MPPTTETVQVPGGFVELREKPNVGGRELLQQASFHLYGVVQRSLPKDVREKFDIQTMADTRNLPPEMLTRELVAAFQDLNRAGVIAFVKSWSLPDPLPTMSNVGELDTDLYDALMAIVTSRTVASAMQTDYGVGEDGEKAKDPASPSVPSPGSNAGSGAPSVPTTSPIPSLSTDGTSSSTDEPSP